MNQKPVLRATGDRVAKLLERPFSRGVLGDIGVKQPSGAVLHYHEYVQHPEGRRNCDGALIST